MTAEFRSLCAEEVHSNFDTGDSDSYVLYAVFISYYLHVEFSGISATGVREAARYEKQSQAGGGTVGRTYIKLVWTKFTFGI
jgi:hypothetical protein